MLPIQAIASAPPPRSQAEASERMARIRATMEETQRRYANWQPLLGGQIEAQLGVLDYQQMAFDSALPKLQASRWKDGMTNALIGCILWRRKDVEGAKKAFADAIAAAPKDPLNYLVPAVLYARAGDRDAALVVLGSSESSLPGHAVIKQARARLANKQEVDVTAFADAWRGFFPEEMQQDLQIRGRREPSKYEALVGRQTQAGPPASRGRGKLARRR